MMHAALPYAATFVAVFVLDLCWVYYVRQVDRGTPMAAGLWASFLFLTSAAATVSYVENPKLLVPAVAGAFFGTVVGVKRARRAAKLGVEL